MAKNVTNKSGEKNPLDNLTAYYEQNKKRVNTITTIVLAVVVAIVAYFNLYRAPRVEKAAASMAYAQRMFSIDSLDLALNGDAQNPGFLKIMRKYSGTPSANLCNYYAGVIYLKKGDFNQAIKHLEDFNGSGTLVGNMAHGTLGDAYMETNKVKDGISEYEKAVSANDNVVAPLYYERLGVAYEMNNQPEKAKAAYKAIKEKYPRSMQAQNVDLNLARLGEID
ncbi:MAG: tetratricopeptide repeat protein [Chitinophagales bacterium]|nr:tetratricopeptide repeat protein [Chitinophagaceae bacterium]MCB9065922.1 tetratricopeptide repeat protein [Chitinophagales bacterium]